MASTVTTVRAKDWTNAERQRRYRAKAQEGLRSPPDVDRKSSRAPIRGLFDLAGSAGRTSGSAVGRSPTKFWRGALILPTRANPTCTRRTPVQQSPNAVAQILACQSINASRSHGITCPLTHPNTSGCSGDELLFDKATARATSGPFSTATRSSWRVGRRSRGVQFLKMDKKCMRQFATRCACLLSRAGYF
jgi:hypothetical protein